jgi:energy-converting hydrogenase Eha subunit H
LLGVPNSNNELDNGKGVESYWVINLQDSWLSESKGEEFQAGKFIIILKKTRTKRKLEINENNLKWLSLRPTAFSLQFMEASIVGLATSMVNITYLIFNIIKLFVRSIGLIRISIVLVAVVEQVITYKCICRYY